MDVRHLHQPQLLQRVAATPGGGAASKGTLNSKTATRLKVPKGRRVLRWNSISVDTSEGSMWTADSPDR